MPGAFKKARNGCLRILLALSVVLGHLGAQYTLAGGFAAVQLFFIISGFYMETVLRGKYHPRRDIGLFYVSRALRIYSVYFTCLAVSAGVYGALYLKGEGLFAFVAANAERLGGYGQAWLALASFGIFGQDVVLFQKIAEGQLVFNPHGNFGADPENALAWKFMAIPQAWTISLELMFYLAAPFLARLSTRALTMIAAASFVARAVTYAAGYDGDPWIYRFFPFEIALFVYGMLARRFHDAFIHRIAVPARRLAGLGFMAACCLVQPLSDILGVPVIFAVWPLYAASLIALPCLFAEGGRLDSRLAELSFPVYLIHWIVIVAYGALGLPATLRIPLCVAGALGAGWAIVVLVERPVDRLRQRMRVRSAPPVLPPTPRRAIEVMGGVAVRPAAAFLPNRVPPTRRPQPGVS